jgi:predicted nucleotidyltransferase
MHGSHAYGMATESSDIDVKGIAIPPKKYFTGFCKRFEQFDGRYPIGDELNSKLEKCVNRNVPPDEKIDSTIYDIRKFFKLSADCNPNIIEVLYSDPSEFLIFNHNFMDDIMSNRELFLSKNVKYRFCGYAFAQLKRIKTHRSWLLSPPKRKPERKHFGLPDHSLIPRDHLEAAEGLIKKRVESWILIPYEIPKSALSHVRESTIAALKDMWSGLASGCYTKKDGKFIPVEIPIDELDNWDINSVSKAAGRTLGYSTNFLILLENERKYRSALRYYRQYQEWKSNRNPIRAEMEFKYGYDCKHGSHLVRLLRMAREILVDGKVLVKRPDAEELLAIRNGEWSFDKLIEWATIQQEELDEIYKSGVSPLPKTPNYEKIDELCIKLVDRFLGHC